MSHIEDVHIDLKTFIVLKNKMAKLLKINGSELFRVY